MKETGTNDTGNSGGVTDTGAGGTSGMGFDLSGGEIQPVILDLTGAGINSQPISRLLRHRRRRLQASHGLGGRGQRRARHRRPRGCWWATEAQPNGDGNISQRNEIAFTDWDASATSDLDPIRTVFDSNGNGLLHAGDARWSSFRIVVTNVDGTTTTKTLTELSITSIALTADKAETVLLDGSRINEQVSFTREQAKESPRPATRLAPRGAAATRPGGTTCL